MSFNLTENFEEKIKPYAYKLSYIIDLDFSVLITYVKKYGTDLKSQIVRLRKESIVKIEKFQICFNTSTNGNDDNRGNNENRSSKITSSNTLERYPLLCMFMTLEYHPLCYKRRAVNYLNHVVFGYCWCLLVELLLGRSICML